ncbi:zeta toxin family protein [Variovorax sp. J22R24]|uniref:zeta toxin family protein n=1 Tax=Variovorax gracilis TaxID=3053502 RepID=UPI002578DA8E|nr:zeta toxin family protein [Variovorax sp. J22R24]MDM0108017.1 zeta toxin family protein [Variovorax sp. J22R24]
MTRVASVPSSATSERELRRLYERCVAPDLLANVQSAEQPVAMIVAGQPGAGTSYAAVQLRKQLTQTAPTAVHVSINRLRAYHPQWTGGVDIPPMTAGRIAMHCRAWFDRLVADVQKQRLNLVAEIETVDIDAVPKLAADLRHHGYIVQAIFVATSREESRLAMMARYEMRRRVGLAAEQPSAQNHELAFRNVAVLLGTMEHRRSVDGLRVITHMGGQIYESRVIDGALNRLPRAQETLEVLMDKPSSAKELVQFAMRWETLVQRLANDPGVPRDLASQTVTWRNQAVARCEKDPAASQMLRWAREAGAFRVMNRFEFEKEFPHHSRAVKAFGLAVIEAERYPPEEARRLLLHARENIAQRIERGDMARIAARETTAQERKARELPPKGPPTR